MCCFIIAPSTARSLRLLRLDELARWQSRILQTAFHRGIRHLTAVLGVRRQRAEVLAELAFKRFLNGERRRRFGRRLAEHRLVGRVALLEAAATG